MSMDGADRKPIGQVRKLGSDPTLHATIGQVHRLGSDPNVARHQSPHGRVSWNEPPARCVCSARSWARAEPLNSAVSLARVSRKLPRAPESHGAQSVRTWAHSRHGERQRRVARPAGDAGERQLPADGTASQGESRPGETGTNGTAFRPPVRAAIPTRDVSSVRRAVPCAAADFSVAVRPGPASLPISARRTFRDAGRCPARASPAPRVLPARPAREQLAGGVPPRRGRGRAARARTSTSSQSSGRVPPHSSASRTSSSMPFIRPPPRMCVGAPHVRNARSRSTVPGATSRTSAIPR